MTEHPTPASSTDAMPFSQADLKQFDNDDAEAGRAIGKMLSLFFLYTIVVMTGAAIATYWWISNKTLS